MNEFELLILKHCVNCLIKIMKKINKLQNFLTNILMNIDEF